jgi:O-antigen/teichoic acid export membrane protein
MSLKKNVLANYVGQVWTALMGLVLVPVYIKYLGMEAYGLIGIFTLLQAWLTLLDMGMTPTLSREMARYTAGAHTEQSIRDLLRTLEIICFVLAVVLCVGLSLCSTWLSTHWLQTEKIAPAELAQAINIMSLVIALRFVEGLYKSAIVGLQQQVWLNIASAILATLRSGGAVLVLIWIAPTIELFFLWQGVVSIITIVAFITLTYWHLPTSTQPAKFSYEQLQAVKRFAGGMMAITLLSLLLTQVDKIILSRVLSLELFGYYTLASMIAGTLIQVITPITQAYTPRFAELVAQNNIPVLIKSYHQGAQLVSVLLIPASLMLVFFGDKLLILWTGNATLVENVSPLLALLAIGTMLNGFMFIPYILTLAYGWTKFAIYQNIIAVVFLIPAMVWATIHYGSIGAAWIWLILNASYVLIAVHFLHRRLLVTEKWLWYGKDLCLPMSGAVTTAWFCTLLQPVFETKLIWLLWLLITGILIVAGTWMMSLNLLVFNLKRNTS